MSESVGVSFVSPRSTVEVHLPDGQVIAGKRGTQVGNFLRLVENPKAPIVGAIVKDELKELTYPINMDANVAPVSMASSDGMHLYRRSLTFLMEAAFDDLFPDCFVNIDHSVAAGGYYCQVENRPPLSVVEIALLETRMRELVSEDLRFIRREFPLLEAKVYFETKGYIDKVQLLSHRRKDYLTLYRLQNHLDYHHGYMVPSTGYLKWFGLSIVEGTDEGFTLRFPRKDKPTELQPPPQYPMLLSAFRQYRNWLERLGIGSVGALDDAIIQGRVGEIILVAEAFHEQHIARISSQIAGSRDRIKIILISGPSSSGKTTFSKRLSIQLLVQGISPFPLEMDNYFIDRENTPRDENGDYDFEAFEALDNKRLNFDLKRLIAGEKVQLPKYNFKTGRQENGEIIQLGSGHIIILEGIHGMNPALIPDIPNEHIFRVYVSTLTQLNLDRHNRISTTDTRLVRRIVRDARERGYSAQDTIKRWESVGRGEKKNIFPYQENADVMFNSALVYELSALKPLVEPLLRQVPLGTPEYMEAKRLLAMLEWFLPIEDEYIPDNSILREFMGNSILRSFKIWQPIA